MVTKLAVHRTVRIGCHLSAGTFQMMQEPAQHSLKILLDAAAASAREKSCQPTPQYNTTYIALMQACAGGLVIYRIGMCMPHMTTKLY